MAAVVAATWLGAFEPLVEPCINGFLLWRQAEVGAAGAGQGVFSLDSLSFADWFDGDGESHNGAPRCGWFTVRTEYACNGSYGWIIGGWMMMDRSMVRALPQLRCLLLVKRGEIRSSWQPVIRENVQQDFFIDQIGSIPYGQG